MDELEEGYIVCPNCDGKGECIWDEPGLGPIHWYECPVCEYGMLDEKRIEYSEK